MYNGERSDIGTMGEIRYRYNGERSEIATMGRDQKQLQWGEIRYRYNGGDQI